MVEAVTARKPEIVKERTLVENQPSLPLPVSSHQFEHTPCRPPEHFTNLPHPDSEMGQNQAIRSLQHMAFVESPVEHIGRIPPITHTEREVTGSPKYGDIHRETKPKHNHRRRNSGDWPSHPASHGDISGEPPVPKAVGRGKSRKARRRSAERREKAKAGRGRGRERNRDHVNERFQNSEFQNDPQFARRVGQKDSRVVVDRPVDSSPFREDWNSDVEQRNEKFIPRDERPLRHGKWRRDQTVQYVRGSDHDKLVRAGSPGIPEQRFRGVDHERERLENMEQFEPQFSGPEMHQDREFLMREEQHGQFVQKHFPPREHNLPAFHDDPRDPPVGEPLPKKPRPLLSDVEINELRNRKGASPNTGRMTPPPMLREGFQDHSFDRDQPFPPHIDQAFHPSFGPPPPGVQGEIGTHTPPVEHHGEWAPGFEIPRELMLDHENEIMRQVQYSVIIIFM